MTYFTVPRLIAWISMITMGALLCASQPSFATDLGNTSASSDDGANLDAASSEALQKTQQMLRNPTERAQALNADPKAAWIGGQTQALGGSAQNTDAIYDLAADILGNLAQDSKGDPIKMMELLEKAKADPQSLHLTADQQSKLHALSLRIPASATGASSSAPTSSASSTIAPAITAP